MIRILKAQTGRAKPLIKLLFLGGILFLQACGLNSAKKHYLLAEKLWSDRQYAEAVAEFEKVIKRDSQGELGHKALYRAAMTETIFLGKHHSAIQKFRRFTQVSREEEVVWTALLQIGEILFTNLKQYPEAIQHYQTLLKLKPESPEAPLFWFRIGRSQFFLWKFADAVASYEKIRSDFSDRPEAEKALFQIGVTHFTRGGRNAGTEIEPGEETRPYKDAIEAYQRFLTEFPKSAMVSEALFGIASCYEEMDQLEKAFEGFKALEKSYPSPRVIQIKMIRIRERIAQRNR